MYHIIKLAVINFLKGAALKTALKALLGSAVMGGFRAWLIKVIVHKFFDDLVEPIVNTAVRKGLLLYDKAEGKIRVNNIEKAKEEGNESSYIDNISDV